MKFVALSTWLLKPACRLRAAAVAESSGVVAGHGMRHTSASTSPLASRLCLMLQRAIHSQSESHMFMIGFQEHRRQQLQGLTSSRCC
jgi:hypothetical protein